MQRVTIEEIDNTRPGQVTDTNVNIPYIPGMVAKSVYENNLYYTEAGEEPTITKAPESGVTLHAYNVVDKKAWDITRGTNSKVEEECDSVNTFSASSFVFTNVPSCDFDSYEVTAVTSPQFKVSYAPQGGGYAIYEKTFSPTYRLDLTNGNLVSCDFLFPEIDSEVGGCSLTDGPKIISATLGTVSGGKRTATFNISYGCYVGGGSVFTASITKVDESTPSAAPKITWPIAVKNDADYVVNGKEPFKANEPIECKDEQSFVDAFGDKPFQYECSASYSCIGFSSPACDGDVFALAGEYDKSYIMARELVHAGLPVLYEGIVHPVTSNYDSNAIQYDPITVEEFYSYLNNNKWDVDMIADTVDASPYDALKEKGAFSVKYITSGGYPVFELGSNSIANKMITTARERGDAVALIDHTDNYNRPLDANNPNSVYGVLNSTGGGIGSDADGTYAAMFTPWGSYTLSSAMDINTTTVKLPASFGYLKALATSIRSNPDWLAIAGVARGYVPGLVSLNTRKTLTNTIADSYQPDNDEKEGVAINAITNIKPYGLTIWGNRTLQNNSVKKGLVAHSFLNTRNSVSNIKKILFTACQSLMFEQNSDILWVNFLSKVTPTLENMQGSAISRYKIIQGKYNKTTGQIEKVRDGAKMYAVVKVWPIYAVEAWNISIVLTDEDVEVE